MSQSGSSNNSSASGNDSDSVIHLGICAENYYSSSDNKLQFVDITVSSSSFKCLLPLNSAFE